jgi:hypothetical protein
VQWFQDHWNFETLDFQVGIQMSHWKPLTFQNRNDGPWFKVLLEPTRKETEITTQDLKYGPPVFHFIHMWDVLLNKKCDPSIHAEVVMVVAQLSKEVPKHSQVDSYEMYQECK